MSSKKIYFSDTNESDKMAEKVKARCKYYNSGFCKFGNNCRFSHPETVCSRPSCRDKTCDNRHPKWCRYGDQCRRKTSCLYKHEESNNNSPMIDETKALKEDIKVLI